MKKVFVVDDNNVNLFTASEALSEHFDVFTLGSASAMFTLLAAVSPNLILLDIEMPEINGFSALKQLKANKKYAEIPVIFLTSNNDATTEALGFELGVVDFISKPFSKPVLLNRIKSHLTVEEIISQRTGMLKLRTEKLQRLQNSMVSVLSNMIEQRDTLTGNHVERTTNYIRILLNAMLKSDVYSEEILRWVSNSLDMFSSIHAFQSTSTPHVDDPHGLEVAISSARLHDIGKIAVSDLILNKPARLTEAEYDIMKSHSIEGEKIIDIIIGEVGEEFFLQNAKLFAGSHHEYWDGTGYPRGLQGYDIPLQGRIMAIADVYDALVSDRPYKKAFSHPAAKEMILESSGKQFDPKIVEVFRMVSDLFEEVNSGANQLGEYKKNMSCSELVSAV
ncbi:MAG: response regulator [Holophagaceae bacterium]|nr:response regulator [Holophagaceae bacterium]